VWRPQSSARMGNRHAFTLLEMLTAMGIFCFAVLGLLYALEVSVDASRELQRQKAVRTQLENRLARLSLPPLKALSRSVEADGVKYTEEIQSEPVKSGGVDITGYWRVRVLAEWKAGGEAERWDASHLVWNP